MRASGGWIGNAMQGPGGVEMCVKGGTEAEWGKNRTEADMTWLTFFLSFGKKKIPT